MSANEATSAANERLFLMRHNNPPTKKLLVMKIFQKGEP
jgi:hypothetical protein